MATLVSLKQFPASQLMFDEDETREILKFFFKADLELIKKVSMSDGLRNFAQGLLVEAVDASAKMGLIDAVFRATANPTAGARRVLLKFGKQASRRWFEHATADDLTDIKIYEIVRARLGLSFRSILLLFASGMAMNKRFTAVVTYPSSLLSEAA